jgi:hypothetical protein
MRIASSLFAAALTLSVVATAQAQDGWGDFAPNAYPPPAYPPGYGPGYGPGYTIAPAPTTREAPELAPPPPSTTAAQENDATRFRVGVGVELGGFFGSGLTMGQLGVAGQIGFQANRNWGIYAVPSLHFLAGSVSSGTESATSGGGVGASIGAMIDYMFDDTSVALAAGPAVSFIGIVCGSECAGAAVLYGGRLRLEYFPELNEHPTRRTGAFLAADVIVDALPGAGSGGATTFLVSPIATIGYAAF